MKREARLLLEKACDSLVLSVELFNRPNDRGRVTAVLIQVNHAFEMLLKAAIVHKGGKIRDKRANETIGFDTSVRRGVSDAKVKFLTDEQALTLQAINGLRDAAQHHLLDISEGQLYMHMQSGVTLFRDLLLSVFGQDLVKHLPVRVLPVSTTPATDLVALFDAEVKEVRKLLQPGSRHRIEAEARLRPLAILDATIRGEKGQPSAADLRRMGKELLGGKKWPRLFPGVAVVNISSDGSGPSISLRLTKKEGNPTHYVPEGTPGATVVALKRVNELDFYNLGAAQLAEKLGITTPAVVAIVSHLKIRENPDYYKEFRIGSVLHKRYSQKAVGYIAEALKKESVKDIWAKVYPKKQKQ